jgi:hypothetical protein
MSRTYEAESGNPFATRATRSGRVLYQFPAGASIAGLIECLRTAGWWGQIVGPHGSGKSTLLAALLPELARQTGPPVVARLHASNRQLPACVEVALRSGRSAPAVPLRVLVIDGYEQLSLWQRLRLNHRCRRQGRGLLVTAHRPLLGLPILYRTCATPETAWGVVRYLLREEPDLLAPADVAARLARHGGDVRELLFELYDWYEARRGSTRTRSSMPSPPATG